MSPMEKIELETADNRETALFSFVSCGGDVTSTGLGSIR